MRSTSPRVADRHGLVAATPYRPAHMEDVNAFPLRRSSVGVSRRTLLVGVAGGLLATALDIDAVANPLLDPTGTPPAGFTFHGRAPDALAHTAYSGGCIHTLIGYQGRIYYGYGNYGANSGSASGMGTNVSYFGSAGGFGSSFTSFRTEEINTYRRFGGALFAPCIDPSSGAPAGNSFASNLDGRWAAFVGPPAEHVFDVCDSQNAGEYLLAGSSGGFSAVVWRTTDYGRTWAELWREPEESASMDGYERFYWLTRIGNRIFMRADPGTKGTKPPMRYYDTRRQRMNKVPNSAVTVGGSKFYPVILGDRVQRENQVCGDGRIAYFITDGKVFAFDGAQSSQVSSVWGVLSPGDDGRIYLKDATGVYVLTGTTKTTILAQADLPGVSMTVANGRIWLGGSQSEIWSRPL